MEDYRRKILGGLNSIPAERESLLQGSPQRGDRDLSPDDAVQGDHEPVVLRLAAVLVPIIDYPQGPAVLLTRRAEHLDTHSGQVAFPGGKVEPREMPVEAALREAEEEVGLDRSFVEVAGFLDTYETGSGFCILPVVSFVRPGFTLTVDEDEVAEVFEVPLAFLMDPANHERHSVVWKGRRRDYYAMPYDGHYIWGATAGMLKNLSDRVFA